MKQTFEHDECINCKLLPLCFGPCIQESYEYRIGKITDFKSICLKSNKEINIDTFVIERFKNKFA